MNFAIGKIPPSLLQPVIYSPFKKGGFLFFGDMQIILMWLKWRKSGSGTDETIQILIGRSIFIVCTSYCSGITETENICIFLSHGDQKKECRFLIGKVNEKLYMSYFFPTMPKDITKVK